VHGDLSIDSFTDGRIRNSHGDIDELIDEVLAGCGQDLPHATTLPAATYTSRAFFDLEVEKIFRRNGSRLDISRKFQMSATISPSIY